VCSSDRTVYRGITEQEEARRLARTQIVAR